MRNMMSWLAILVCLPSLCFGFYHANHPSQQKARLVEVLMDKYNYNKDIIPDGPEGGPVIVTHKLDRIDRIVSFEGDVLEMDGIVAMEWVDSRLMWDPTVYKGVTKVRVDSQSLWTPDIVLFSSSADPIFGAPVSNLKLVVNHTGKVSYFKPTKFRTYCKLIDYYNNMVDSVTCNLKYLSWTYDGYMLDFNNETLSDNPVDLVDSNSADFHSQWRIASSSVEHSWDYFSCCPEPYPAQTYTLVLEPTDNDYSTYPVWDSNGKK